MSADLVPALKTALGSRLVSLVEHSSGWIMVLTEVTTETLRLVAGALGKRRPETVFFSPAELADSLDVFPVELLEAQAGYQVLAGEDVLQGLEIPWEALRLQLEEDLKTQRTWLRQRFLDVCGDDRKVGLLAVGAFATLPPLLRGLLRYRKVRVPSTVEGQLQQASETFGLDLTLLEALQAGKSPPSSVERYEGMLNQLIAAIENG